ncbi:protocatechuate 3,4-dioxygenase subunit alpha [Rhodococcus ruber]|uniref:Protocatechuate 3,4-dioxygenase subunit alpha n=1 Tax=Rhodococcus ruber TaxID=1830 RepID=A0ABT4MEM7_9NOCA|nr:protocatechuate 3,4-dioxygenase subunit alpha [Rhodococcus ruber]MCZ4519442.1 protocatechuate 3,4-dioxygenase subunit alpha [Rhodococcus ruber]
MTDAAAAVDFVPRYPIAADSNFTTVPFGQTPSQTVGPYLHIGLTWPDGPKVVPVAADGALIVTVRVVDGARTPVADAMIETWQADAAGRFDHSDDPRGPVPATPPGFRGFGRAMADSSGTAIVWTVKPGALPTANGQTEAPHIDLAIFGRGMLDRLVTRIYFPDELRANSLDPVLASLECRQREKLTARATPTGYHFDVVIQDADPNGDETPFFLL